MDIVLVEEWHRHNPWTRQDNFINPLAMLYDFWSLELIVHQLALFLNGLFVSRNTDYQVDMWEKFFGLFKDFGMADVEHVENAISVNSHWVVGVCTIRCIWIDRVLVYSSFDLHDLDIWICFNTTPTRLSIILTSAWSRVSAWTCPVRNRLFAILFDELCFVLIQFYWVGCRFSWLDTPTFR